MITDKELRIANESYTHKDFYQIYPEILELAQKMSRLWDPASSNESDPGVVLLKLLAFIADKTNYNIDKNILEAFMPSATQEDSMRKLCDMMGYNMKYYQSAVADVSFMWIGEGIGNQADATKCIKIPQWTELTDDAEEVVYTLIEEIKLTYKGEIQTRQAIEGKLCDVSINDDNLVKLINLDDKFRFYLPESKVAENGIWMKNEDSDDWNEWYKVDNLNTVPAKQPVWKFGYDSRKNLPYIQFPEDIADLIGGGLQIKYIRTSGTNGNITAKALTRISNRTDVDFINGKATETLPISVDNDNYLVIENSAYTLNGQDIETLDEAYNSFKKTIGTFDTLVTCRDYANKIYQLTYTQANKSPLVSNVQVSDIKDDLNFATKIVSFDDYGLFYSNVTTQAGEGITNFDIYIYPLKDISNYYKGSNYTNSFKPNYLNTYEIINQLQDYKTLAHTIKQISNADSAKGPNNIYAIKNYYHLTSKISTTYKVTEFEGVEILNNIYYALWNTFNARKNDYGEELPYDVLLKTIETADPRIKSVSLDEPELSTSVMYGNGEEDEIINTDGVSINNAQNLFLTLIAKNVLAGKLPLFNYDTRFKYELGMQPTSDNTIYGKPLTYPLSKPLGVGPYSITAVTTSLSIPTGSIDYTLKENEIINIISPSLRSEYIYSSYVNYYFKAGPNLVGKVIKKDTEYQLNVGDELYFNYTDTNDVIHDVKYWRTENGGNPEYKVQDNQNGNPGQIKTFSGIIKPNFDLEDSQQEAGPAANPTKSWSKTDGDTCKFIKDGILPGMFSLDGTNQIEIRNLVQTEISTSPFYCYWSLNNTEKLVFKQDIHDSHLYRRILGNDEYFFYTDTLKQSLVTLGSGTTLTLKYTTPPTETEIVWTLKENNVSLDDVASKGIGAFADTNWKDIKFTPTYNSLIISENEVLTLGEGTLINKVVATNALSYEWQDLTDFMYDNKPLPKYSIFDISGSAYKIQTNFNLNMSSTEGQVIHPNTAVAGGNVTRSVQLYTTIWRDKEGTAVPYDEENRDKLTEELVAYGSAFTGSTKDYYLRSNYDLNQAGGKDISMHRYTIEEKLKDDLYIYPYEAASIEASEDSSNPSSLSAVDSYLETFNNNYYKISLDDYKLIKLPIFIPKNCFGLIMMYYSPSSEATANVTVAADAISAKVWETTPDPDTPLTLNEGINILKIWNTSDEIVITAHATDKGTLIVSPLDVVSLDPNDANDLGVNYKLLNITKASVPTLFNIIGQLDSKNIFYYNAPINKYNEIDTKVMDQYSFFNYNNVYNKFTIAELDTDNSDIQIAKSSRVTKW